MCIMKILFRTINGLGCTFLMCTTYRESPFLSFGSERHTKKSMLLKLFIQRKWNTYDVSKLVTGAVTLLYLNVPSPLGDSIPPLWLPLPYMFGTTRGCLAATNAWNDVTVNTPSFPNVAFVVLDALASKT
jgi:hypothetical protein